MCGIFGLVANDINNEERNRIQKLTKELFILSQSRGKDSAGIFYSDEKRDFLYKKDLPGRKFIKTNEFIEIESKIHQDSSLKQLRFIGHCRMVTNGTEENPLNNQPVLKNQSAIVHNGIVCNIDKLWQRHPEFKRVAEVDSEIFADLIRLNNIDERSIERNLQEAFSEVEGSASIALLSQDGAKLLLATNTGSLFYAVKKKSSLAVFASERFILQNAIINSGWDLNDFELKPLLSRHALFIENKKLQIHQFTFSYKAPIDRGTSLKSSKLKSDSSGTMYRLEQINKLKRCSRCVLPESFPFIEFDKNGVCNYCLNYTPKEKKNRRQELQSIVEQAKINSKSDFDCIVPFSGGRDSSYGLHYLVHEMKLKPITYTYDWGMVTDLARRNISRICGDLGVENILISADIKRKRENIRKNVLAWLKKPNLGLVPLFMAGDKQFLFYVNRIKKQTGVNLDIWMPNRLENTDFKTSFCNIPPAAKKGRIDSLSLKNKMNLMTYYGINFLLNPSYLNSSLLDSFFAYFSYYFEPRDNFTVLYDYIAWDEDLINSTLINKYNWETSPDSSSTWRIGDGTAPFYNYIYTTIAGFSEIDTFRSNQIREGMLSREKALELVVEENYPRVDSIRWYLNTINVDFDLAIKTINNQKTIY